jgi:NAD-dependent DNA ligase
LNETQQTGLKYYEDILEKIPREEIDQYNQQFSKTFSQTKTDNNNTGNNKPQPKYEIVGSYRRGAKQSGDIDVILTSDDPQLFTRFLDSLVAKKIIIEVLSRGKSKCLVIAKLTPQSKARRVDFLYSTPQEFPFAILYFTGSKAFNTVMRGYALKQGYSFNEHGITHTDNKKTQQPQTKSPINQVFEDEKAIFDFLGLVYKTPEERIDGRAVNPKTTPNILMPTPPEPVPQIPTLNKKTLKKAPREPKQKSQKQPKPPKEKKSPKNKTQKNPIKPKTKNQKEIPVLEIQSPPQILFETIPEQRESPIVSLVKSLMQEEQISLIPEPIPEEPQIQQIQQIPLITASELAKKPKEKTRKKEKEMKSKRETQKEKPKIENVKLIQEFKQKGLSLLETLEEQDLVALIKYTNNAYYNTSEALLTDNEFDILKEYTEKKYPNNAEIKAIGAPIIEKNKVNLPYEMPSMDKIKPDTNALTQWKQNYSGPYVLSCKLDGVSGLYVVENNIPKLYTRGDGKVGQDITHLLPTLKLPVHNGYAIRGEFIIPKRTFENKYKINFANPRNLVSGIINAKKIDSKTQDLHFVTYEVIYPELKPSEQMSKLVELKHEVVRNESHPALTNEQLSETLLEWRQNYDYEIDGVIVTDDKIYPRVSGNPDHAFAFKMVISDQLAECKVVDVIWNPSKNGYLKPRVRIEPVGLGGVTIEYATGFNGKFIEDNKIGIGALIQIVRSGDVIPYIKAVTVPAETAKMPEQAYTWTDTHVDIILENFAEDATVREKNATGFFTTLEVDGLSSGNIKRLFKAGYDSVSKILKMSKADFETVEGFKEKTAEKLSQSIREKVANAGLLQIMVASNKIGKGMGERKIQPILEAFPQILTSCETPEQKTEMLKTIKGIGKENAQEFVQNIPSFMAFLEECGLENKLHASSATSSSTHTSHNNLKPTAAPIAEEFLNHPLYKRKIVMSKIRDKQIIDLLPKYGATLEDGMKKDVFALVIKSHDETSNKTEFAKKNGIPIYTPEEFKAKFLV